MKQEVIPVLDRARPTCGPAVDRQGKIIARASTPNASDIAAENGIWHQWSLEAILQRFAGCCHGSPRNWPIAVSAGSPSPPSA